MNTTDSQRYAPPTARVDDIASADQGALAGRGARLGAAIIDGLLQAAVYFALVYTVFPSLPGGRASHSSVIVDALLQILAGYAIFCALNARWLATRGQTVGKRVMGVRIVRSDGSPASLARVLGLRYGVGWVVYAIPVLGGLFGLVDALLIFRESHKCLHDNIADTIVLKA